MHMTDSLVNPAVAGTMYALSAVTAGISIAKIKKENDSSKIPLMGVMAAFVFACQMINFSIPGTGSSGHLCGAVLLSSILGPFAAFLTMISVLFIQALFFADGGLLALGCNVWNMAFYGCFVTYFLVWQPMMKKSCNTGKIVAASIISSILALQFGAFSVTLETLVSGITELPFKIFVSTMQPIHLAIGLVEGLITSAVLVFIYKTRSELLSIPNAQNQNSKISVKASLITLMAVALVIAGLFSYFASSNPDGLEWSIQKITGDTEIASTQQFLQGAQKVQDASSFLPDYSVKNAKTDTTGLAGIIGCAIVLGLTFAVGLFSKLIKKQKSALKNQ